MVAWLMAADVAPQHVLRLDRVSFRRGSREVLREVTLDLRPGERLGLIGPSGAGKTTLLRLLAGLERPASGVVQPAVVPGERSADGIRVGLLFQDLGLFPHMRVRSNVAFPLLARSVPRDARRRRATEALVQAGIGDFADRFPGSLSGGERQRVAIVRTLLSEPSIVLLDEPFASLDPHLVGRFAEWLEDLRSRAEVCMVLVTHDVRLVMRWADRLAILVDGAVEQVGSPTELYARPRTAFVATFLGEANVVDAVVIEATGAGSVLCEVPALEGRSVRASVATDMAVGARCRLVIRPEHLAVGNAGEPGGLTCEVAGVGFAGRSADLLLTTGTGASLRTNAGPADLTRSTGEKVTVRWPPVQTHAVAP
ncbi:ABC transporter ATP-binding protein [Micromonospora sp. C95]|uniref:ABC transporter ATP-binding protein n=1 Tax=Micromonospora sp. C95 TaxID=2824882 RepID=UPI001B386B36|nr:ABC transporter ATP-binding protein [Micromonospora sp. C95]MBQ1026017.1 ABC transporter ATP-binding protein [Micromonospora sp. C95]